MSVLNQLGPVKPCESCSSECDPEDTTGLCFYCFKIRSELQREDLEQQDTEKLITAWLVHTALRLPEEKVSVFGKWFQLMLDDDPHVIELNNSMVNGAMSFSEVLDEVDEVQA